MKRKLLIMGGVVAITGILNLYSTINKNKTELGKKIKRLKNPKKETGIFKKSKNKGIKDYMSDSFSLITLLGVLYIDNIIDTTGNLLSDSEDFIQSTYDNSGLGGISMGNGFSSDSSFSDSGSCSSDGGGGC